MKLSELLKPLNRAIYRIASRLVDRRLRPFGRIPIRERKEQDIYIVGFPKSGNNWMQNLLAGLVYHLPPDSLPDSLVQELVPDIDYYQHYQRYFPVSVFRTHAMPNPGFRRVVYLLRDPRDVFVSLLHFRSAVTGRTIEANDQLADARFSGTAWRKHVESWLSNPYGAEMLVVRFEDLKREPEAECSRLADFLGLSRTKDELKTVVSQSSFQHLRRKEEKFGKSNPGRWPSDKRFYRQGEVGSYRAELSVATKEALLKQVAPAFEACGYEDGRG